MLTLILVLLLMVLLVGSAVSWAVREERRRKLAAGDETKEGVNA
jgi:hypothetical protein